jgi:hypothetical protein
MAGNIFVLDPSGEVSDPERHLAPRLTGLEGKLIGLVGVTRDTPVRIGEVLVEQYGARDWVFRQKPNISEPCPEETFEELRGMVDCLVVGVGV